MTGFWGKLPSRGDFCGMGLSRTFVAAWDAWISACLAASQAAMGDAWREAWMEAPVWFFQASSGLLGPAPVSGLWMPSVDRAGRFFPLMIAVEGSVSKTWFAAAEQAGRDALSELLEPELLLARLPPAESCSFMAAGSSWWTDGAPRVAACEQHFWSLPKPQEFVLMLDDAG